LKRAVSDRHDKHPQERPDDYGAFMRDAVSAGFDHILVCNAHLLAQPFPANTKVIAQTPHFALLEAVR
jgi:hypothetical protein